MLSNLIIMDRLLSLQTMAEIIQTEAKKLIEELIPDSPAKPKKGKLSPQRIAYIQAKAKLAVKKSSLKQAK